MSFWENKATEESRRSPAPKRSGAGDEVRCKCCGGRLRYAKGDIAGLFLNLGTLKQHQQSEDNYNAV